MQHTDSSESMMMVENDCTQDQKKDHSELTAHFDKYMQKPVFDNLFKLVEKKYQFYHNKKTDFSQLIDCEKVIPENSVCLNLIHPITNKPLKAYMLNDPPGLVIIKDYFTLKEQIKIAYEALNKYIYDPFRTNLYIYEEYSPFPKSFVEELKAEKLVVQ